MISALAEVFDEVLLAPSVACKPVAETGGPDELEFRCPHLMLLGANRRDALTARYQEGSEVGLSGVK